MPSLKPIAQQTIVITGASSGIGLATARMAAARGARVVLASRNPGALDAIAAEIRATGGHATAIPTDVSHPDQVERLATRAIDAHGGFDTWVNNAGVSIFGWLTEIDDADHRQLFETNFWGTVYGSKTAAKHLREKGGAIVNLGSVASDLAIPVQGMYSASKHAIKGFTDALRLELAQSATPISVSLIKPASIDTPFPTHAMNALGAEPKLPPPLYHPDDVAEAILHAAAHGGRDIYVGGGGRLMSSINKHLPTLMDVVTANPMMVEQQSDGPSRRGRHGALYGPGQDGEVRGGSRHWVRRSTYTRARRHPALTAGVLAMAALAGAALIVGRDDGRA